MANLILVRHSLPEFTPGVPANQWVLSELGRQRCASLAAKVARYQPDVVVTSTEPKAMQTGGIVAGILGRPCITAEGLHEHERSNVGYQSKEQLDVAVADFFAQPGRLVFGTETADQAYARFSRALARLIERYPDKSVAVVSHGTVMTLFVTREAGLPPFSFWKQLGLPAFVVLSLPEFALLSVVNEV